MTTRRFGVTRPMHVSDIDGAWLVVVIRPDLVRPEPTARHIDTYKVRGRDLPEDPSLVGKVAGDLRELADDLERHGWDKAFREPLMPSPVEGQK